MKKKSFELSVVIPAFNEEKRIKNTLIAVRDFIEREKISAEIIVVNDGSSDKTKEIVKEFQRKIPNLRLVDLHKNMGKGFAVKKGVYASNGKFILFTDADNSTPIEEYKKLLDGMLVSKANIAIGSRYLRGSNVRIKQSKYRILLGRAGNFIIRLFLIDGISDTQCGFKLFENKVAREIFRFQKINRFAFDVEVLVIADNLGYKIVEVPVSWFNSPESRVRPIKDVLRTLRDFVYIKLRNLWSGRYPLE